MDIPPPANPPGAFFKGVEVKYWFGVLPSQYAIGVTIKGQLTMEWRKRILREAASELKRYGFRNLIIDITETTFGPEASRSDFCELLQFMRQLCFPDGTRIAMIHPEPDERREYFNDLAALESFGLDYKLSKDEALDWFQQR